jgi:hypothetical protein
VELFGAELRTGAQKHDSEVKADEHDLDAEADAIAPTLPGPVAAALASFEALLEAAGPLHRRHVSILLRRHPAFREDDEP